ncbi:MAG TPA: alanine racemase [Erysipelotrichaceae bacterium]|nr:alanine racemase [Erysipelotrichaceae bacterium]
MTTYRKTNLEINLNNLSYNYNYFKTITNKAIFSIVKANAYGLGIKGVSKHLEELGSDYLGVATLDEALALRSYNIKCPILVMGYVSVSDTLVAKENNITLTVLSLAWAKQLADKDINNLSLHIKVNTSMNRLGHNNLEEVKSTINLLQSKHNLEGIYTHYCCEDLEIVEKDFHNFKYIVENLSNTFKWVHASNSANALNFKEDFTNAVRVGIGLYGGLKSSKLKNVASLKSEVSLLRSLKVNETVSYEGIFRAKEDCIIAVIPVGYADGVLRADKNNKVYINNKSYPIVGNVCMDQLMILVDDKVSLYDEVEIFGENIKIEDIAKNRDSIVYEVLSLISNRVNRLYIK